MADAQDEDVGRAGDVAAGLAVRSALGEPAGAESEIDNAAVSAGIEERLARVNFGEELAAEGVTTVCLDADDNLVEYRPDGASVVLRRL